MNTPPKPGLLARLFAFLFRRPRPRPNPNEGLSQFTDAEWRYFLNNYLARHKQPTRIKPRRARRVANRGEAILAVLAGGPMDRRQITAALADGSSHKTISATIYNLHRQGVIRHAPGGKKRWELVPTVDKPAQQP